MSELIDRQAALNALMDAVKSVGVLDADDIKTVFDMLPSVQQEKAQLSQQGTTKDATSDTIQFEPHEGHWINGKCDLCGEHAPFWAMASTYHESNYCPCCGAKMKGAEHETN